MKSFNKREDKEYVEYTFYSGYREELQYYHSLFYQLAPNGKNDVKRLPSNLKELLVSVESLAVWYMDDGTKRGDCNAGRIATQGFTWEEQSQLVSCLQDTFSITTKVDVWRPKKKKTIYGLSIPSGEFTKFCDLIRPFIETNVPWMLYKLETPRND